MTVSAFITELDTRSIRPGWARVLKPFKFYSHRLGGVVIVEDGFEFDWDSIPRLPFLHAWLKGRAEKAACGHDKLYRSGCDGAGNRISRWEADLVMLDLMVAEGVSRRHRWAIYAGVVVGGWVSWNRHRGRDGIKI